MRRNVKAWVFVSVLRLFRHENPGKFLKTLTKAGAKMERFPAKVRSYICNFVWAGQSKYTYPFITHGLSLNAYFKTGTQLLTNAVAHSLGLDLEFVKEWF